MNRTHALWLAAALIATPATTFSQNKPDAPKSDAPGTDAPKTDAPTRKVTFSKGQAVEIKWGAMWRKGKVAELRPEWVLVEYEGGITYEWVEPFRLRKPGETTDIEPAKPNKSMKKGEITDPPNTPKPGATGSGSTGAAKPGSSNADDAPAPWPYPVTAAQVGGKELLPVYAGDWQVPIPAPDPKLRIPPMLNPTVLPPIQGSYDGIQVQGTKALIPVRGKEKWEGLKRWRRDGFVRVDVTTNSVLATELPDDCVVAGFAPSGNLVATKSEGTSHGFEKGDKGRLDVFKIAAKPEHVVSFVPFDKKDISKVAFLSDERLLISGQGALTCWELKTATQRWSISMSEFSVAPDNRQVAVLTSEGIAIIDSQEEKVIGVIETSPSGSLAWAPDGSRLFQYARPQLKGWDIKTGQNVLDVGVAETAYTIAAVDKDFLTFGPLLYSVAQRNFTWRYDGGPATISGGRGWTVFNDGRRSVLTSAVLPHPKAKQAAAPAAAAQPIWGPGMSVALDINPEGDPARRDAAVQALTLQLQRKGFKIDPAAPIRIVARTETGPSETHEYRVFGRGNETVTVTRKITRLQLQRDGKTLWETSQSSGGYAPSMVNVREGESIQSVVDKGGGVDPSWIGNAQIPTLLMPPVAPESLPSSKWALAGVKDN